MVYLTGVIYYSSHTFGITYVNGIKIGSSTTSGSINEQFIKNCKFTLEAPGSPFKSIAFGFYTKSTSSNENTEIINSPIQLKNDSNLTIKNLALKQNPYSWIYNYKKDTLIHSEIIINIDKLDSYFNKIFDNNINSSKLVTKDGSFTLTKDNKVIVEKSIPIQSIYSKTLISNIASTIKSGNYSLNVSKVLNNELNRSLLEDTAKIFSTLINKAVTFTVANYKHVFTPEELFKLIYFDPVSGTLKINQDIEAEILQKMDIEVRAMYPGSLASYSAHDGNLINISPGGNPLAINTIDSKEILTKGILDKNINEIKGITLILPVKNSTFNGIISSDNKFIEVNLSSQILYLYSSKGLLMSTPIVSGDVSKNRTTPLGSYSIVSKEKNSILRGENYNCPVSYWMPFYKECGFHDAWWRKSFDNKLYLVDGSHGCINMPLDKAGELYDSIHVGTGVSIHD